MNLPKLEIRNSKGGLMLIECLVYISVFTLVVGLSLAALYRCWDYYKFLNSGSEQIVRALHAGEQWREDVRRSEGRMKLADVAGGQSLQLHWGTNEIEYLLRDAAILRRTRPDANWSTLVTNVVQSTMTRDARIHVTAWRWELKLQPPRKARSKNEPAFTFLAVPVAESRRGQEDPE